MIKNRSITKRLAFRIIAPVILLMLLAGSGLYVFFHYIASDFVAKIIKNNLDERASDIYSIVDKNMDELLKTGLSGDEKSVRIKKALTLSMVEDAMRQNDLRGAVMQEDKSVLLIDDLSLNIMKASPAKIKENMVSFMKYDGKGYYLYLFEFEPWKWRIWLIRDETEYLGLINKIKFAYAIMGILLLMATAFFIYYFGRTVRTPLQGIIEPLKNGIKPGYKGIYEFEFLSDNIGSILESLQNETLKLNSIYHIAISKRGKEFFDEVASAISGMFNLNVSISKVGPGRESASIISMYFNGRQTGEMEIPLAGTPCENVMFDKKLVVIEEDVCLKYPSSKILAEINAGSYAGFPVCDRKGDVIGIVSVFGGPKKFSDADLKVLQTISQMVAVEFEMLEKTVYLDNILHASTDTAIVSADNDFRITYFNPAAEKILGFKAGDVIGKSIPDMHVIEKVDHSRFQQGIDAVRKRGEHQYSYEKMINGEARHVEAKIYGMLDEQNKLVGYVMMARDITDYKLLEEQLLHSQKLEAVGLLAGGVAHEFNNILMAIMGYVSLLQARIGEEQPSKRYADNILMSSEKAAHLTQGLLAFSRKQIINPKPVKVNGIVRRIEGLLTRLIGEDIELRTALDSADLTVIADSGQIEQVLMNLATNARDAMPNGGILTIGTELATLSNDYAKNHFGADMGKYALISVSDTGTGIDEKTKEHIFEPFFTSKEVGKGTGLGLSIVFGIIKQHNGNIIVYSEPGKGTTFKIYLPLSSEQQKEESKPSILPPPRGGSETLLLAEDNDHVRNLVKSVLKEAGYSVIIADSADAVNIYTENKDQVHMLLLDVVMPKRSGMEIYTDIRKINPEMKALFMSGYAAEMIHKNGWLEEGVNFISKPISPGVLLRKVREIIDS